MRRTAKGLVLLGILGAVAYAVWRLWQSKMAPARPSDVDPTNAPFPFPPEPRPASTNAATADPWVEPRADGSCPDRYPVKAKLSSGIYHVPGGANYERTKPDRCYVDEAAAIADGLRRSKV